jgi:hypothetical protein
MELILLGIAYVILLAFCMKLFQRVHRWDEEICSMNARNSVGANQSPSPGTA